MRHHVRKNQAGFSLLEMLIAVGIMSAAAYVALDTVENNTGQHRYELTELRAQKIRRAIVGDPNLVVNGSPAVSGFVADVGRLPDCLEALTVRETTCDGETADIPPAYGTSATASSLSLGWRGPYLTAGTGGLADGWGNSSTDGNWGWTLTPSPPVTTLNVTSFGRDRVVTSPLTDSYDDDYAMPSISSGDFTISLAATGINIEITNTSNSYTHLCMAFLAPDPVDATDWELISISAPVPITFGATEALVFSAVGSISIGLRPLIIYDAGNISVDTNCQPKISSTKEAILSDAVIYSRGFSFVPRMTPSATIRISL